MLQVFCSSSCRWSNDVGEQIILCMFFCYSPMFEGLQIFFSLESVWIWFAVTSSQPRSRSKCFFNLPAGIFLAASRNYFAKLLPQMLLQWRKLLRVSPPVVDHWILVQSKFSWYSCWFDLAWTSSHFLSRPWPCMVSLTWSRKLIKCRAVVWFQRGIACSQTTSVMRGLWTLFACSFKRFPWNYAVARWLSRKIRFSCFTLFIAQCL